LIDTKVLDNIDCLKGCLYQLAKERLKREELRNEPENASLALAVAKARMTPDGNSCDQRNYVIRETCTAEHQKTAVHVDAYFNLPRIAPNLY
jgi:hypothetical protein